MSRLGLVMIVLIVLLALIALLLAYAGFLPAGAGGGAL
jgi:hypothetical protein